MSQAASTPTTSPLPERDRPRASRRAFLAAAPIALPAALGTAGGLASYALASAEPHPDAALIDLCRRVAAETDRINTWAGDWTDARVNAECAAIVAMEEEIAATVPATLAGLAAKARVIRRAWTEGTESPCHDDRLLDSLFASIEAMAGEVARG